MSAPAPHARVRPYGRPRVAAPTGEEAAAFDRRAIDELGVPQRVLMENAGRAAAQVLERLHPRGRVTALVGSGNNGGDALVMLRTLASWGRPVEAVTVGERTGEDPLLHGWDLPLRPDDSPEEGGGGTDVLVDGILGTGIRGAPRERQARAIRWINAADRPVVSLDVPSGVDSETGAVPGEAVEADLTIAFGWPKLGTLLHPGRAHAGRLVAVEIGFPPPGEGDFRQALITPGWAAENRPRREPETHKYRVGTLVLVAGRKGMAGACVLAGRAALRAGAGLLRVVSPPDNREIVQESVPEAIWVDASDREALEEAMDGARAVAAGPGMGRDDEAERLLEAALDASGSLPLLLDADALTLLGEGRPRTLDRVASDRPVLVTPHAGEMERISGLDKDEIRERRVDAARRTAERLGCAVLLKGLPSLVAAPDGRVWLATVASSDLATGGMGDVLTGVAGSFLAQGLDPWVAGSLALHVSGRGAARAGKGAGLTPGDVVEGVRGALREEGWGSTDLGLPFVTFDQDAPR